MSAAESRRAWRCLACEQTALTPWDACPRCGAWGVCRPLELGAAAAMALSSARRRLDTWEARPVTRLEVCAPWLEATGGGLAAGSAALVYGRAGVGKTTLALALAASVRGALYLAAEVGQGGAALRLIAERLSLDVRALDVAEVETLEQATRAIGESPRPALAVVDSISVLGDPVDALARLRAAAPQTAIVALAHQTKEGRLAGREALRHACDAVFRVNRRAIIVEKNRYAADGRALRVPR